MKEKYLTLGDLRFMFNGQTRIFLTHDVSNEAETYIIHTDRFEITKNFLLWGTDGFAEIPVYMNDIYAVGMNKIEIKLRIPDTVFNAWAEYAKKNKKL